MTPLMTTAERAAEAERDEALKALDVAVEANAMKNEAIAIRDAEIASLRQELKGQVFRNEAQATEIAELKRRLAASDALIEWTYEYVPATPAREERYEADASVPSASHMADPIRAGIERHLANKKDTKP